MGGLRGKHLGRDIETKGGGGGGSPPCLVSC